MARWRRNLLKKQSPSSCPASSSRHREYSAVVITSVPSSKRTHAMSEGASEACRGRKTAAMIPQAMLLCAHGVPLKLRGCMEASASALHFPRWHVCPDPPFLKMEPVQMDGTRDLFPLKMTNKEPGAFDKHPFFESAKQLDRKLPSMPRHQSRWKAKTTLCAQKSRPPKSLRYSGLPSDLLKV